MPALGDKSKHYRKRPGTSRGRPPGGRIPLKRYAQLDTFFGRFLLNISNPWIEKNNPTGVNETGFSVTVVVPNVFRPNSPIHLRLSYLTLKELNMLQDFFNMAFEKAKPVVAERDRLAKEATEQGDLSHSRSWRTDPKLVVRDNADLLEEQRRKRDEAWAAAEAEGVAPPEDVDPDEGLE